MGRPPGRKMVNIVATILIEHSLRLQELKEKGMSMSKVVREALELYFAQNPQPEQKSISF